MVETEAIHGDANLNTEPSEFVNSYRSGSHTLAIAEEFGMKGYTDTINTACSSSANAIMLGARLIRSGRAKRAIVGGVDSLSQYTVNGFNALQIFSDEMTQPFDEHRKGLNLGEGAAYLVLEREEDTQGKTIYGEVRGFGNANDAYHPSSMSPDAVGVRGAIEGALKTANLRPSDIDHINAHGTGNAE
jgi:3-oxoacyl-(acyl-carrier-protein) synthase